MMNIRSDMLYAVQIREDIIKHTKKRLDWLMRRYPVKKRRLIGSDNDYCIICGKKIPFGKIVCIRCRKEMGADIW